MASQNEDPRGVSTISKTSSDVSQSDASCHSVKKRLQQELMTLMMNDDKSVSAFPCEENIFCWIGTINGARGTVYEGLTYKLKLEFPNNYPYNPPNVYFTTPCFHPNVNEHGSICLDIFNEKWTALYDVRTILISVQSLLSEPNINSPLNPEAAKLWKDQATYKRVLLEKYDKDVRKLPKNVVHDDNQLLSK